MDNEILVVIIGAVAGLISGTIASLIAPWLQWGIEKKKIMIEERKTLLKDVREVIIKEFLEHENFTKDIASDPNYFKKNKIYPNAIFYYDTLNKYSQFQRVKSFIPKDVLNLLQTSKLLSLEDRGSQLGEMPKPFSKLNEAVNKIEKDWKLL